jgi:xanthine dehydrogenase YagR molybdenum-binding subunit
MSVVGQPLDRVDGRQKITGAATYAGDVRLPGLAYGVLVLSTVARGRVKSADIRGVSRLPGVLLVMTPENAPRLPQGGRAAVNPPAGRVLSLLQDDAVHYNRQPVAVVVAETLPQAAAAAAQLDLRYASDAAELDFERTPTLPAAACPGPGMARECGKFTQRRCSITTRWSRTPLSPSGRAIA